MNFKNIVKNVGGFVVDTAKSEYQHQVSDYEKYGSIFANMSDEQLQKRFDRGNWHGQGELRAFKEEIDARGIHLKKY